jgi:hypothetical protein
MKGYFLRARHGSSSPAMAGIVLGVAKVATKEELVAAMKKVAKYAAYSRDGPNVEEPQWQINVLIEEYCDGPEVDCNFVLWDGQILFFQVIDNFPCAGDAVTEDM